MDYKKQLINLIKNVKKYGIDVNFGPLPKTDRPTPVRGAFSSTKIILPRANPEEALFILVHGIGHIAQWSLFPEEQTVSYLNKAKTNRWTNAELRGLLSHELRALPYSLGFLEQNGASELCQWYRQYFAADQMYINKIFRTNKYQLSLFSKVLFKLRQRTPSKVSKTKSRPLPPKFTTRMGGEFIHVI